MPVCAVKALSWPKLVLVVSRGIKPLHPDSLEICHKTVAQYSCKVWCQSEVLARACGQLKVEVVWWSVHCHATGLLGHHSTTAGSTWCFTVSWH